MIHMRKVKIEGCAYVSLLVLLFAGLVACSAVSGSPLTDDVATLDTLRENIPKDYIIRVRTISKDVGRQCWLHLNLYPVESSLKTLALKFGNLSTNRENITIFITMLQGLRFTIDNEDLEVTMQSFKCHYRTVRWSTKRYFDHVKEVLKMFAETPQQFHCTPPRCRTPKTPPIKPDRRVIERTIPSVLALLVIPCIAALALILKAVLRRKMLRAGQTQDSGCKSRTDCTEAQSDLASRVDAQTDHESCSLSEQYRVLQDTFQVEDTAV